MRIGISQPLPRTLLALAAMGIAMALLASLLLLSGNPRQAEYRGADQKLRYLQDVTNALSQSLDVAVRSDVDVRSELLAATEAFSAVSTSLDSDLTKIYAADSGVGRLRSWLMVAFNSIDQDAAAITEPTTMTQLTRSLQQQRTDMNQLLGALAESQHELAISAAEFAQGSRGLVNDLRDRGREIQADEVFRMDQQIQDQLRRQAPLDLDQATRIAERLTAGRGGVSSSEQQALTQLGAQAQALQTAQARTIELAGAIDLSAVRDTLKQLRERTSTDYLALLSVVNEARILLNIFTVLLLGVLAYFGLRLSRSYTALNHSHDDLEDRVQERTSDLETALSELKESQVQLVQAEKMSSLGQLVAGVMHEINTPLLYVQSNASVTAEMAQEIGEYVTATLPMVQAQSPAEAQNAMKELFKVRGTLDAGTIADSIEDLTTLSRDSVEGLDQISELVQSLKDFSRLDRAAEDRYDVREGLEKTLVITKNLLKYGVEVEKNFNEVPDIFCAPSRINQVFINLINNAVQAMDGKGVLKLTTQQVDDWVEVIVEDTGCGISEENLSKIMDPFFTTKPVGEGTGLGLSIVHKIVQEHGGQILIDSKEGIGTRMTLGFPVRQPGAVQSNDEEAA
ncbi:MAG: ATP-binding protein [Pseudomonadales bacterium]